jgi:hypothetical protein
VAYQVLSDAHHSLFVQLQGHLQAPRHSLLITTQQLQVKTGGAAARDTGAWAALQ